MRGEWGARIAAGAAEVEGHSRSASYYIHHRFKPNYAFLAYGKSDQADLTPAQRQAASAVLSKLKRTIRERQEDRRAGETIVMVTVPHRIDVAAIRARLGLSRPKFAARFGFSVRTLAKWETGER